MADSEEIAVNGGIGEEARGEDSANQDIEETQTGGDQGNAQDGVSAEAEGMEGIDQEEVVEESTQANEEVLGEGEDHVNLMAEDSEDLVVKDEVRDDEATGHDHAGDMETDGSAGDTTHNDSGDSGEATHEKEEEKKETGDEDVVMKGDREQKEEKSRKILRQITVNIGPIKIRDLSSPDLHRILRMSNGPTGFNISFSNTPVQSSEKLGYVKIPFEFKTERFLLKVADNLGSLKIEGRDMSVNFPDEFNKVVVDVRKKLDEERRKRAEKRRKEEETQRRCNYANNIPPSTTPEMLKEMFPSCKKVTIPKDEKGASLRYAMLEFDTPKEALKVMRETNDFEIGDYKIRMTRHKQPLSKIGSDDKKKSSSKDKDKEKKKEKDKGSSKSSKRTSRSTDRVKRLDEIKRKHAEIRRRNQARRRRRGNAGPSRSVGGMRNTMRNTSSIMMGPPRPMAAAGMNPAMLQAMQMNMALNQMGMPFGNQGAPGLLGPVPGANFGRGPEMNLPGHGLISPTRGNPPSLLDLPTDGGRRDRRLSDGGSLDRNSRRGRNQGRDRKRSPESGRRGDRNQGRRDRDRDQRRGDDRRNRQDRGSRDDSDMTNIVLQLKNQLEQMQNKMQESEKRERERERLSRTDSSSRSGGRSNRGLDDQSDRRGRLSDGPKSLLDSGSRGGSGYQLGKRPAPLLDTPFGDQGKSKRAYPGSYPDSGLSQSRSSGNDFGSRRNQGRDSSRGSLPSSSYGEDYMGVDSGYGNSSSSYTSPSSILLKSDQSRRRMGYEDY